MVSAVAADEAHAIIILVDHHAIAIHLFLVYPTIVMEGARKQRRVHQGRD
jgi:hypothetical protein